MLSLTITTSAEWTTTLNLVSWTTKFKIKLWDPCHFASARPWDLPFDPSRTCRGTKSELAPYDLASNSQDSACDKLEDDRHRPDVWWHLMQRWFFFPFQCKSFSSLLFSFCCHWNVHGGIKFDEPEPSVVQVMALLVPTCNRPFRQNRTSVLASWRIHPFGALNSFQAQAQLRDRLFNLCREY